MMVARGTNVPALSKCAIKIAAPPVMPNSRVPLPRPIPRISIRLKGSDQQKFHDKLADGLAQALAQNDPTFLICRETDIGVCMDPEGVPQPIGLASRMVVFEAAIGHAHHPGGGSIRHH